MTGPEIEDLYSLVYGVMAEDEMRRDDFLDAEARLTAAFLLVKHLDDCRRHADEVIFCQRVRNQLRKALPGRKKKTDVEQAVRDLVDDAVESEGVVDIFKAVGLPRADISVLDESFLQTFKDKPQQNLRLMLLEQLLSDEIRRRQPRNLAQAKSFRELLERTLQRYHNRLIDAATVVAEMLRMKRDMDASDARARDLGLQEDEVAFYDAVAASGEAVYEEPFLRDLVHDVVQTINRMIDVFPAHQQQQIRTQLSFSLEAVFCQILLPRADGRGRVMASEIMLATPAIRSLIREDKAHQLMSLIQTGGRYGMRSMNQAIFDLYRQHLITYDDALSHSMDTEDLKRVLMKPHM